MAVFPIPIGVFIYHPMRGAGGRERGRAEGLSQLHEGSARRRTVWGGSGASVGLPKAPMQIVPRPSHEARWACI